MDWLRFTSPRRPVTVNATMAMPNVGSKIRPTAPMSSV
jgi:hypothetical protein